MDARDRHNGQRDKRTNERTNGRTDGRMDSLSVRPSLRWSLTLLEDDCFITIRYANGHFHFHYSIGTLTDRGLKVKTGQWLSYD